MQQVLHYSAIKTGVAYIDPDGLDRRLLQRRAVARHAARRSARADRSGSRSAAGALVLYARLPADGHYFWNLFPAFLLSGIGLALSFVPMVIGGLTGVTQPTPESPRGSSTPAGRSAGPSASPR